MPVLSLIMTLLLAVTACATSARTPSLYLGSTLNEVNPSQFVTRLMPGHVVIIGENHGFPPHHQHERELLRLLSEAWPQTPVSVGFEFLSFPDQKALDDFTSGKLSEADFLKAVGWGANNFADYRDQMLWPRKTGGQAVALNAPRLLSRKISQGGLESLTENEKRLLPPAFQKGNALYYKRFKDSVFHAHPGGEEQMQKLFWAQSLWDDTMADQIKRFIMTHPDHLLVVIVGDFHVAYGGGLPDRLKARGVNRLTVISQVDSTGASSPTELLAPHPVYGPRADLIWASSL